MTSEPTSGRSDRHEVRRTVEDIRQIVLSEYWYWRNVENEAVMLTAMGAMGAAANILCAIDGHRAPWHPKPGELGFPTKPTFKL